MKHVLDAGTSYSKLCRQSRIEAAFGVGLVWGRAPLKYGDDIPVSGRDLWPLMLASRQRMVWKSRVHAEPVIVSKEIRIPDGVDLNKRQKENGGLTPRDNAMIESWSAGIRIFKLASAVSRLLRHITM